MRLNKTFNLWCLIFLSTSCTPITFPALCSTDFLSVCAVVVIAIRLVFADWPARQAPITLLYCGTLRWNSRGLLLPQMHASCSWADRSQEGQELPFGMAEREVIVVYICKYFEVPLACPVEIFGFRACMLLFAAPTEACFP